MTAADPAAPTPIPPFRAPPTGRGIAVIGNCQALAMVYLYNRFVAGRTGDRLSGIPSSEPLSAASRGALEAADLVVEQVFDRPQQADIEAQMQGKPRLLFPMVSAPCFWPFAGAPHPKNESLPFLVTGPYGAEYSDSYLNRLIDQAVPPDDAAARYLTLDIVAHGHLDSILEQSFQSQQARDAQCGFTIAPLLQRHFRTEPMFLTPNHPGRRITLALAAQFARQLGATQDELDRMETVTRASPLPRTELPVHPGVAAHFGLEWAGPDRRYRFMNEGSFTFREFVLRYMRYEWNRALAEGGHLASTGNLEEARDKLLQALAISPHAAVAHSALSNVLNRMGDRQAALAAAQTAIALEPQSSEHRVLLGGLLNQMGQREQALTELRAAVASDPANAHALGVLAVLLRQLGQLPAARAAIDSAIRLDPYAPRFRAVRAECLADDGDTEAAIASLVELAAADRDNEMLHLQLNQARLRAGHHADATASLAAFLERQPAATRARLLLSDCHARAGNPDRALEQARHAATLDPQSAHAHAALGHRLLDSKDLPAAEAALRRAAALDAGNAHVWHDLSLALHRQRRTAEAIEAARESATRQPANPRRLLHLAHLQERTKDRAGARETLEQALRLAPRDATARARLDALLAERDA